MCEWLSGQPIRVRALTFSEGNYLVVVRATMVDHLSMRDFPCRCLGGTGVHLHVDKRQCRVLLVPSCKVSKSGKIRHLMGQIWIRIPHMHAIAGTCNLQQLYKDVLNC